MNYYQEKTKRCYDAIDNIKNNWKTFPESRKTFLKDMAYLFLEKETSLPFYKKFWILISFQEKAYQEYVEAVDKIIDEILNQIENEILIK